MTQSWQFAVLAVCSCFGAISEGDDVRQEAEEYVSEAAAEALSLELLDWADATASAASYVTNINLRVKSMGRSTIVVNPGATVHYRVMGELSDDANQGLALIGFDLDFEGGPLPQADEPTGEPTGTCENPMINFDIPWGLTNPAGSVARPSAATSFSAAAAKTRSTIHPAMRIIQSGRSCSASRTRPAAGRL
jgi:hypothetical protein